MRPSVGSSQGGFPKGWNLTKSSNPLAQYRAHGDGPTTAPSRYPGHPPPALNFPVRTVSVHPQWTEQFTPSRKYRSGLRGREFSQPDHRLEYVCAFLESLPRLPPPVSACWVFVDLCGPTPSLGRAQSWRARPHLSKSFSDQRCQAQFPTHGILSFLIYFFIAFSHILNLVLGVGFFFFWSLEFLI